METLFGEGDPNHIGERKRGPESYKGKEKGDPNHIRGKKKGTRIRFGTSLVVRCFGSGMGTGSGWGRGPESGSESQRVSGKIFPEQDFCGGCPPLNTPILTRKKCTTLLNYNLLVHTSFFTHNPNPLLHIISTGARLFLLMIF